MRKNKSQEEKEEKVEQKGKKRPRDSSKERETEEKQSKKTPEPPEPPEPPETPEETLCKYFNRPNNKVPVGIIGSFLTLAYSKKPLTPLQIETKGHSKKFVRKTLRSGNINQAIALDISKKTSSAIFQKNANGTYDLSPECRKLIACSDFDSVTNKLAKLATGKSPLDKIASGRRKSRKTSPDKKRKLSPSSSESDVKKKKRKTSEKETKSPKIDLKQKEKEKGAGKGKTSEDNMESDEKGETSEDEKEKIVQREDRLRNQVDKDIVGWEQDSSVYIQGVPKHWTDERATKRLMKALKTANFKITIKSLTRDFKTERWILVLHSIKEADEIIGKEFTVETSVGSIVKYPLKIISLTKKI